MLDVLTASGPATQVKTRWLTTSIITHALVITVAVVTTRASLNAPPVMPRESMSLLFAPKPPEPSPPGHSKAEHSSPIVSLTAPPPQGFQTVIAPTDIPKIIPPVNLNQRPL